MSMLCEIVLDNAQRNELLAFYDQQIVTWKCKAAPGRSVQRPSLAIDMLAHNVRSQYLVPIYVSHVGDVLQFAVDGNLAWLERLLVQEYGVLRERRKAAREASEVTENP